MCAQLNKDDMYLRQNYGTVQSTPQSSKLAFYVLANETPLVPKPQTRSITAPLLLPEKMYRYFLPKMAESSAPKE